MNGRTRKKKYSQVVERDGEYCKGCQRLSNECELVLDHINNNPKDDRLENLQILCRQCNYLKNPRRPLDLCEREIEAKGHTELQINRIKESEFRKFVFHEINERGTVLEKELINDVSEQIKISPVTGKRYLDKMCSNHGPLERGISQYGKSISYKND
jgi:hypothetical protein